MNSCEEYEELISRMLDGDLTEDEQAHVKSHIASCPECRRLYDTFSAVTSALTGGLEEPPEDLKGNIMSAVKNRGENKVTHIKHWKSWAAIAACFVLVIAGAFKTGVFNSHSAIQARSERTGTPTEVSAPIATADATKPQTEGDKNSDGYMLGEPDPREVDDPAVTPDNGGVSPNAGVAPTSVGILTVAGSDGTRTVTDAVTQDKICGLLAVKQTATEKPGQIYDYTVLCPDGKVLSVRTDGDKIYCRDTSTGESYLASGSAKTLSDTLAKLT